MILGVCSCLFYIVNINEPKLSKDAKRLEGEYKKQKEGKK